MGGIIDLMSKFTCRYRKSQSNVNAVAVAAAATVAAFLLLTSTDV